MDNMDNELTPDMIAVGLDILSAFLLSRLAHLTP